MDDYAVNTNGNTDMAGMIMLIQHEMFTNGSTNTAGTITHT